MRFRKDLGDLTELKRSITEIGQLHPIVFDQEGTLISGERRLMACQELGIEPLTRVVNFKNGYDREQAEIEENSMRRDFLPSEIYDIYRHYSKKMSRQGQRTDLLLIQNGKSEAPIEFVGKLTGLNKDTISHINIIFNRGDRETIEQVDKGRMSISEAYYKVRKQERIRDKIEKLQQVSGDFSSEDIKVHYQDFFEYSQTMEDCSVDFIMTDPPYEQKFFDLWVKMFQVAERVLKPSRFLVFYFSPLHFDQIFKIETSLRYFWSFKLDFTRPYICKCRNIMTTYKLAIIYEKPPMILIPSVQTDKVEEKSFVYENRTLHEKNWGQNIDGVENLIERFTNPGDLIFDPMTGTGTTALACQRLKRRFIGCEIEKKYQSIIEGRLINNE